MNNVHFVNNFQNQIIMKENFIRKMSLLIGGICLVLFHHAKAQTSKILSLEDAITLGIAHSKQLQTDNIQMRIADSKVIQGQNLALPQVGLNLSYIRISDNITPFRVNFPTGDVVLNPQILNQSYNSLQVKQVIYAGGKFKDGIQLLAFERKALLFDMEKNKTDVSYNITTLLYNLFTVKESKKLLETNIELLNNQKKDAENFVKQGIVLASDVLKIDLAVTNLQSGLIDITNSENLLRFNLCLLTGIDPKTNIDIPETLPIVNQPNASMDDYLTLALNNRPELKALNIRQQQANLGLKMTQSNVKPILSAGGKVNYDLPNQRVFPNQASVTGTWDVGVFLNWNLSELFTNKEKVKENVLSISKLNTAYEQAKEGIQLEVNANYNNYLQTKQKIVNAKKAVEQATENFRIERNKFAANTTTSTEFLNANTLLIQSKINLITATANAELAYKKLEKSTK